MRFLILLFSLLCATSVSARITPMPTQPPPTAIEFEVAVCADVESLKLMLSLSESDGMGYERAVVNMNNVFGANTCSFVKDGEVEHVEDIGPYEKDDPPTLIVLIRNVVTDERWYAVEIPQK